MLARYGVPVPRGEVAFSPSEAADIARRLGGEVCVVKAQIHAGGRGKGGGVKLARSITEVEQLTKDMLGMTLVTHQTGPEGKKVGRVLIEEGLQIDRELYLSIVIDRASASPVVIASAAGGMDIEEVAASHPEKILRETVDRGTGILPFQGRKLAFGMGLSYRRIETMPAPTPRDLSEGVWIGTASATIGMLAGIAGAILALSSYRKLTALRPEASAGPWK